MPTYRPEIDGLRAIAVLAVLCFHLSVPGVSGGYVGVDIFLVISGYLITRNILHELQAGSFSFSAFYLRRLRRLYPALLVTVVATLAAAFFVLTPEHYQRLGKSSLASIFSVSNFFFWSESGYFNDAKAFKPLLHTWSLAVEEQFYLFWPLFLFTILGFKKKVLVGAVVVMGIASLLGAEFLLSNSAHTAFFMMPLRICEFAVGALLVFVDTEALSARLRSTLAPLGLVLMGIPVIAYDNTTTFPGVMAMLPCLGAALVIASGDSQFVGGLLKNRVAVAIGKMSYSLYLVHWPVIILVSYWKLGGIGWRSMLVMVPTIFVLAFVLHRYVEVRFRYPTDAKHRRKKISWVVPTTVAVCLVCVGLWTGGGWSWRYPQEAQPLVYAVEGIDADTKKRADLHRDYQREFRNTQSEERHYVIGDSFAEGLFIALKLAYPELNLGYLNIPARCQPVLPGQYITDSPNAGHDESCNAHRERVFGSAELATATTISIAASWREPAHANLAEALDFLEKNTSANIMLFGPRATFIDVPTMSMKYGKLEGLAEYIDSFKSSNLKHDVVHYRNISEKSGVGFVDLYNLLCDGGICPVLHPVSGKILYSDHAHWSRDGFEFSAQRLRDYLGQSYNHAFHLHASGGRQAQR